MQLHTTLCVLTLGNIMLTPLVLDYRNQEVHKQTFMRAEHVALVQMSTLHHVEM